MQVGPRRTGNPQRVQEEASVMSLIRAATGIATLIVAASVAAHAARADRRLEARYHVSGARSALTGGQRRGIVDPMTALLVTVGGSGDVLAPEACQRTLPIFDGRRRYDLKLAFKRIDTVKADKGYRGPAVVCGVTFQAIAG